MMPEIPEFLRRTGNAAERPRVIARAIERRIVAGDGKRYTRLAASLTPEDISEFIRSSLRAGWIDEAELADQLDWEVEKLRRHLRGAGIAIERQTVTEEQTKQRKNKTEVVEVKHAQIRIAA
jgi:hypothetical protein